MTIKDILINTDKQKNKTLCPYLALSFESNFLTPEYIRLLPSHFGRMSIKKILDHAGFNDINNVELYCFIESGMSFKEISEYYS